MKRLYRVVDVVYDKLHNDTWDNCWILSGDEGKGKTSVGLNLIEYWYTKKYGKCLEENINALAMDSPTFVKSLSESKKGDIRDYDEGGELNNKRTMDKFNVMLTSAYRIIRNENLFSIITITDPFDINPFFLKRRARGLIYVYKRGKIGFWDMKRLRKLVDYNANQYRKNVWRVRPLFLDTFPIYKGVLAEPYKKMKDEFTDRYKKALYQLMYKDNEKDKMKELIVRSKNTIGAAKTAEIFEKAESTVYNICKEYSKSQDIEI